MSKPNAAAYSVARLLRESECQQRTGSGDGSITSLAQLTQQIDAFLADAPNAPAPLCVEEVTATTPEDRAHRRDEDTDYVEMNVVAGVLEPKSKVTCATMNGSTLLLPSEANKQQLQQQRVDEAQALLNLMGALGCSGVGAQRQMVAPVGTGNVAREEDDSDSSVAVMDADDLLDEDSSDDEPLPQRRRVEEI